MDISGSYTLHAPREQVWDALLDPDILKRTVPGCESLERTGDNEYAARLHVGVAGIRGIYDGTLKVLDTLQPDSYRLIVDGTGTRGILHGDGMVRLEAHDPGETVVRYSGQARLGGTVASVGMQVASGAANMLIKQYFAHLADLLPTSATAAVASEAAAVSVAAPAPANATAAEALSTAAPADEQVSQPAVAPAAVPISPVAPAEAPAAPIAAAAMAAPASSTYVDGNSASEQTSARTIGAIASVVAIVIVVLVVWLLVSRQ